MPGDRIGTLLEALPYIREFHGKTIVIKYGGAAMEDAALREDFARDVVLLKYVGLDPIIVHGGGPEITSYMQRLDMPVEFVGGINRHGQPAVGLSGDDGQLFRAARMQAPGGEDIGFVGRIERVDVDVI